MAQGAWLEDIKDELERYGYEPERSTSRGHELWVHPKYKERDYTVMLPLFGRDTGRMQRNVESLVLKKLEFLKKHHPELEQELAAQLQKKRKGMSPDEVNSWKPMGPPGPVPVMATATVVVNPPPEGVPDLAPAIDPEPEPERLVGVEPARTLAEATAILMRGDAGPEDVQTLKEVEGEALEEADAALEHVGVEATHLSSAAAPSEERKEMEMAMATKKRKKPAGETKCPFCDPPVRFELPQGLGRHVTTMHKDRIEEYRAKYTSKKRPVGRVDTAMVIGSERIVPPVDAEMRLQEALTQLQEGMRVVDEAYQFIKRLLPGLITEQQRTAKELLEKTQALDAINALLPKGDRPTIADAIRPRSASVRGSRR